MSGDDVTGQACLTCRVCGFPVTSAMPGPQQGMPFADGSMAHFACYMKAAETAPARKPPHEEPGFLHAVNDPSLKGEA